MGKKLRRHGYEFTAGEISQMLEMWKAYVPVEEIADSMGRSRGAIRQQIMRHNFPTRNHAVTRAFKHAPEALKAALPEIGEEEFLDRYKAWQEKQYRDAIAARDAAYETVKQQHQRLTDQAVERIRAGADKREEIIALRAVGVTLKMIGDALGVTRERVRQIEKGDMALVAEYGKRRKGVYNKYDHAAILRMIEAGKMTYAEIAEKVGCSISVPASIARANCITRRRGPRLKTEKNYAERYVEAWESLKKVPTREEKVLQNWETMRYEN